MGEGATRARDRAGATAQHVIPAWIAGGITVEPKSKAVPYVWHWRDRIPMAPGDLVLTPNWTWHDHANDTEAPMIWRDGLDTPLVRMLEAGFFEEYGEQTQTFARGADPSVTKYGAGGLRPAWEPAPGARYSPLWHYPWSETRAALERLAIEHEGSPFDGVILEYTNPLTGDPRCRPSPATRSCCGPGSTPRPTATCAARTTT
jgi:hypothetical protein